ncbi:RNA recognition motif domain-containing protein [Ditylenchus destructor]|nr:RNA recognition motif domain-containing protein [Ditylenchus destructor]
MSCLRSALRRYIKNSSILSPNDVPFPLQRCHNFNILDLSCQTHTCVTKGVAENLRCSLSKSHFGKPKAITAFFSVRQYSFQSKLDTNHPLRRLLLLGLSKFTTKESINEYFAKFGTVTDSGIVGKRHSGILGFVEFESKDQANAAAKFFPHEIDNHEVSVVRYLDDKFDRHKIFVGGLHWKHTTNAAVREFYSQFGEIISCYVGGDTSRKYAIISFNSQEAVDRALSSLPHCIDRYNSEITDAHQSFKNNQRDMKLQMRVLDLSPKTTDESLKEFYSKFGSLTQCEVKKDPNLGESDGYGYVTFATKQGLNRALDAEPHIIDGAKVFFQYCTGEMDLWIYRVPEGITEEMLQKYFSEFGEVRSVRPAPMRDRQGHVFVCFSSLDEANRALEARPHIINGKVLQTKSGDKFNAFQALNNGAHAIDGEVLDLKWAESMTRRANNLHRSKKQRSNQSSTSLIIPFLPENVSHKSLTEEFSKFGVLTSLDLVNDERPYAIVSYATQEDALKAFDNNPHTVEGKPVRALKVGEMSSNMRKRFSISLDESKE